MLDSAKALVTVMTAPPAARTVSLDADVVLSGAQGYELVGTPDARIRLEGNGYRIVSDGEPLLDENDIYFSELFGDCPDLVDKVMQWIMLGSPGIPVKLDDGGETTLEALDTFRDGGERGESAGAGLDVPELRNEAEPDTPAIG